MSRCVALGRICKLSVLQFSNPKREADNNTLILQELLWALDELSGWLMGITLETLLSILTMHGHYAGGFTYAITCDFHRNSIRTR